MTIVQPVTVKYMTYEQKRDAYLQHIEFCTINKGGCFRNHIGCDNVGFKTYLKHWTIYQICPEGMRLLQEISRCI